MVLGWVTRAAAKPKFGTALPHPFERLCAKASASDVEPLFFQMHSGHAVLAVPPGGLPKLSTVRWPPK